MSMASACGASGSETGESSSSGETSTSSTSSALPSTTSTDAGSDASSTTGTTGTSETTDAGSGSDESSGSTGGPPPTCTPPSWLPQSGTVVPIPALDGAATLAEVIPQPTPFNRPPSGHLTAWNGGVLLHLDGLPYLATHGGGHGDYAGNEINVFGPLCGDGSDMPSWRVLWGPTPEDEVQLDEAWNFDGNPNISHTRDTMAVLGDSFFRFWQSGPYPGVNASRDTLRFDVSTLAWDGEDVHPDVPSPGGVRGSVVADPSRGVVWIVSDGASQLVSYDPTTQAYTTHGASYTTLIEITAGLDSNRDQLLVWDGRDRPGHLLFDLANPDDDPVADGFSGAFPPYKSGIEFDPVRDRYVALGEGEQLDTVHELDPETRVWSTRTFDGDTFPSHNSQGHFGRFRYVPELGGYVYVGRIDGPVFFFRS